MARLVGIARLMPIVTVCYDTQPIGRSFFFELACFSLGQMVRGVYLDPRTAVPRRSRASAVFARIASVAEPRELACLLRS